VFFFFVQALLSGNFTTKVEESASPASKYMFVSAVLLADKLCVCVCVCVIRSWKASILINLPILAG
jgi:hypothetical protein